MTYESELSGLVTAFRQRQMREPNQDEFKQLQTAARDANGITVLPLEQRIKDRILFVRTKLAETNKNTHSDAARRLEGNIGALQWVLCEIRDDQFARIRREAQ